MLQIFAHLDFPVLAAPARRESWSSPALCWPVDGYFRPGPRETHFLGCAVEKQHHTLTQILMGLLRTGFVLEAVEEAEPPEEMMDLPGMADELRRPMMLLVRAKKT